MSANTFTITLNPDSLCLQPIGKECTVGWERFRACILSHRRRDGGHLPATLDIDVALPRITIAIAPAFQPALWQ